MRVVILSPLLTVGAIKDIIIHASGCLALIGLKFLVAEQIKVISLHKLELSCLEKLQEVHMHRRHLAWSFGIANNKFIIITPVSGDI